MELDGDGGWGKENDEPERSTLKAHVPGGAPRELSFRPTLAFACGSETNCWVSSARKPAKRMIGDPSISAVGIEPSRVDSPS